MRRILLALMFLFFATSALAQTAFDFPNAPTANQIVTGPSNQQFQWDGSKWVALLNAGVGGGFTAGGDLSGTSTAQTVIGLQTKAVPSLVAGYLHWNGTAFVWDTPAGGSGGGIAEAPTDGNAYLRANSAWTSGGTIANDIIVSAVHLTNLSGWAPINFGNPNLAAGTSGAVTASLFAYNGSTGGDNNLNITAGAHMWNGNWVSDTPTAEAIVFNPTQISLQYSTGNTVGSTLGTWNTIGTFASNGLNLTNESVSSLQWPHSSITSNGTSSVPSLAIQAGGYYNGTNWIATSTQVLGMSMFANGITFGYAGAAVGSSYTIGTIATISGAGINLPSGENYYSNGTAIGGTCTSGQYISAFSGSGAITCGTPAGGGGGISEAPTDGNAYLRASSAWSSGGTLVNPLTTPTLHLTNESTSSLMWPHGSMDELGSSSVPYLEMYAGGYWNGSQYIATSPTQLGITMYANSITFGYSGAAVGNAFSASAMATMSANGINIPTGENYYINSVSILPVSIANGGTGLSTISPGVLTSNGSTASWVVPLGAGMGGTSTSNAPTVGQFLVAPNTYGYVPVSMSGDCTLGSSGAVTCTKTNSIAFSALATATVPLSLVNGGTGTSTGTNAGQLLIGQSGNVYAPRSLSQDATIAAGGQVTVAGIQTKLVPTPAAGYLHYNGSAFVWDTPASPPPNYTSWTPVLSGSTAPTVAYVLQQGRYWQLGQYMYLWWFHMKWSSVTGGSGQAYVQGFPLVQTGGQSYQYSGIASGRWAGITLTAPNIGLGCNFPYSSSTIELDILRGDGSTAVGALTYSNIGTAAGELMCEGIMFTQ